MFVCMNILTRARNNTFLLILGSVSSWLSVQALPQAQASSFTSIDLQSTVAYLKING